MTLLPREFCLCRLSNVTKSTIPIHPHSRASDSTCLFRSYQVACSKFGPGKKFKAVQALPTAETAESRIYSFPSSCRNKDWLRSILSFACWYSPCVLLRHPQSILLPCRIMSAALDFRVCLCLGCWWPLLLLPWLMA